MPHPALPLAYTLLHKKNTFWFGCLKILLWFFLACSSPLNARTLPIQEIEILPANGHAQATPTALPHFIAQNQSGLLPVNWQIRLPSELLQEELPTLLLPQPIQGARFSLQGQVIFDLPRSTSAKLYNWYSPVLIQIPPHLLKAGQDNTLLVEQQGHLRGWFIAPMLAGSLQALRPLHDTYNFISQTLSTTINLLCSLLGLFLVIMGIRTRQKNYLYSGLTILTWSILYTLALINKLPAEHWFAWRLFVYFLTGWLIYFVTRFTFSIFDQKPAKLLRNSALILINMGWLSFALFGQRAEGILDIVWTGLVVCLYIVGSGWVIGRAMQRRDWQRITPIALHWLVTSCLAVHDYALQAGTLPLIVPTHTQELWQNLALQPIYLTHLALPAFAVMALWLLAKDLIQKTSEQLLHTQQLYEQRERIVSDIHDGVGSRINLLLWNLRSTPPEPDHIENELQRCMDELRFAINPRESGQATLHQALQQLCQRQQPACAASGITLQYEHTDQPIPPIATDTGLHLYKATQECLSNALRHSQAKYIVIRMHGTPQHICIDIEDNGQGIANWDNHTQSQRIKRDTALGLISLQSRMQARGGVCHIQSGPQGTHIRLALPTSH